ncbi:hypothetical protein [Kamptonema formosum]|uniref:hypothetical protein n=1 Tax=Kamptonema formosum TaxID=331992 RepID=UPI0012DF7AD4|nr:hypothetical protein [Oscillatoria sp. PCC 10802]
MAVCEVPKRLPPKVTAWVKYFDPPDTPRFKPAPGKTPARSRSLPYVQYSSAPDGCGDRRLLRLLLESGEWQRENPSPAFAGWICSAGTSHRSPYPNAAIQ